MGLFESYCKKCDTSIPYFNGDFDVLCGSCSTLNTIQDRNLSFENINYFKIIRRKEKIKKLLEKN